MRPPDATVADAFDAVVAAASCGRADREAALVQLRSSHLSRHALS